MPNVYNYEFEFERLWRLCEIFESHFKLTQASFSFLDKYIYIRKNNSICKLCCLNKNQKL